MRKVAFCLPAVELNMADNALRSLKGRRGPVPREVFGRDIPELDLIRQQFARRAVLAFVG